MFNFDLAPRDTAVTYLGLSNKKSSAFQNFFYEILIAAVTRIHEGRWPVLETINQGKTFLVWSIYSEPSKRIAKLIRF